MMLNAARIYPHNTPTTKEAYYYRMIFERFFPQVIDQLHIFKYFRASKLIGLHKNLNLMMQNSARLTVPGGPSIACSTAKAVEWDARWSNNLDPSGRAALGVHASAYDPLVPAAIAAGKGGAKITNKKPRMVDVTTPGVIITG